MSDLIIRESKIPHAPYHIIDSQNNFIATIHQDKEDKLHALLFKNSPVMEELLWNVLNECCNGDKVFTLSIELMSKITSVLNDICTHREEELKDWKDIIYEKFKDEPLPDSFTKN